MNVGSDVRPSIPSVGASTRAVHRGGSRRVTGSGGRTTVIVIGAGIVGCSAAYYLATQGCEPVVIDAGGIGEQASTQNAGGLHFQLSHYALKGGEKVLKQHLDIAAMNNDAQQRWKQVGSDFGSELEVKMAGGLVAAETDDDVALLRRKVKVEWAAGFETEFLDGAELAALAPELSPTIRAASWHPHEGSANSRFAAAVFARHARGLGARFRLRSPVHGLRHDGRDWIVSTGRHTETRADAVLVTAGAWTARILAMVGANLPMELRGLNMCVTDQVKPTMTQLVMHVRRPVSVKQMASGNVVVGGGRPTQLERIQGGLGWRALPSPEVIVANMRDAAEVVQGLDHVSVIRTWQGILGSPADGMPVLGAVRSKPGLFVAVGGHTGYTVGPTCGALAADLIDGRRIDIDLTPFRPDRFAGLR